MLKRAKLSAALLFLSATSIECARNPENDLIPFSFTKKPLLLVIEELAAKKKLNVVLPTVPDVTDEGSLDALKKQTVTFHPRGRSRIPVEQAWNILQTMAELSGFSLLKKRILFLLKRPSGKTVQLLPVISFLCILIPKQAYSHGQAKESAISITHVI